jgi:ADP-heptose:LPS heptosyltransferase
MHPATVRRLDAWLGRPLCFALTLARRAGSLLRRTRRGASEPPPPPRKILILKLIEQGATVLAYRAIERAVQVVGRENVYFLVFERNRAILDLLDLIPPENVLAVRDEGLVRFARDVLAALWRVRRTGIDATIDMEFFARASAVLTFLSGARRRVGLHRFTAEGPYRGDLFTHRVQYNPYLHTAAAYYLLVEALEADPAQTPMLKSPPPSLDWTPPAFQPGLGEVEEVEAILAATAGRVVDGRIVLLNPNASDLLPLRRWPTDRFVELARRLLDNDPELTVVITGGPDEREAGEVIARAVNDRALANGDGPRAVCLAGRTTLRQLIVLYTMADVLVTNDSGPGHFATLSGIDAIVLFGPETPTLFGPLGPRVRTITAGLACSPCVNAFNHRFSPCTDNACMQSIDVQTVHEAVRDALEGRRGRRLSLAVLDAAQPRRRRMDVSA